MSQTTKSYFLVNKQSDYALKTKNVTYVHLYVEIESQNSYHLGTMLYPIIV